MAWYWYVFWLGFAVVVIIGVAGKQEERKKDEELRSAQLDFYRKNK